MLLKKTCATLLEYVHPKQVTRFGAVSVTLDYLPPSARDYTAVCQSISARGAKWKIAHLHPKSESTNTGVSYFFTHTLRKIHTRKLWSKVIHHYI